MATEIDVRRLYRMTGLIASGLRPSDAEFMIGVINSVLADIAREGHSTLIPIGAIDPTAPTIDGKLVILELTERIETNEQES